MARTAKNGFCHFSTELGQPHPAYDAHDAHGGEGGERGMQGGKCFTCSATSREGIPCALTADRKASPVASTPPSAGMTRRRMSATCSGPKKRRETASPTTTTTTHRCVITHKKRCLTSFPGTVTQRVWAKVRSRRECTSLFLYPTNLTPAKRCALGRQHGREHNATQRNAQGGAEVCERCIPWRCPARPQCRAGPRTTSFSA